MALGAGHSCARTFGGDVWCWGRNGDGQLGDGTFDDSLVPVKVPLDAPARFVAAGTYHTCAVLIDGGTVRCWGDNANGQLGIGSAGASVPTPTVVVGLSAASVSLGEQHTCAVGAGDLLYCWGSGDNFQTGTSGESPSPVLVAGEVEMVAAGAFHTCFVGTTGTVFCMGDNFERQCGQPGVDLVQTPATPFGLEGVGVSRIASGIGYHTCAVTEDDDRVFCWGDNDEAQLGLGFSSAFELPTPLSSAPEGALGGIAPGIAHTCAIFGAGSYCWGDNYSGQLGTGLPTDETSPAAVGVANARAIGSGSVHSCAYVSPELIQCWGGNAFGQLGDGTTQNSQTPVTIQLPN
jgi:alpha-tubulin suppressor-like RCC1 family protein